MFWYYREYKNILNINMKLEFEQKECILFVQTIEPHSLKIKKINGAI